MLESMARPRKPDTDRISHLDAHGAARMVEVSAKPETAREAVASGLVRMRRATVERVVAGRAPKGDVLAVARVAGIQATKRVADLIPLCHPVRVTGVDLELTPHPAAGEIRVRARVRAFDRTGVEMEALAAVAIACLTLYDMLKGVDRGMEIAAVRLEEKRGGRSGEWRR